MQIELDDNQAGQTGDLVPSVRGAAGQKHFVSPMVTPFRRFFSSWPFGIQIFAPEVSLKASDSTDFDKKFKWENATPVAGTPHKANVSRMKSGHFHVKIKDKKTGTVMDEIHVWIVWAKITASDAANTTGDKGAFFLVKMGYDFTHRIKPGKIITAAERPDLSGANTTSPTAGLNYAGSALSGGADKKWDSSRMIRQKTLNPAGVALPTPASFHDNFHQFPSTTDGDGRPGGAGTISFRDWLVAGNDDAGVGDENNDPYTAPNIGKLLGTDTPSRGILHTSGKDGDTVEYRIHFLEFTRLEINGKWYLISDYFPWRVHYKFKKVSGKWKDDSSDKAKNNEGF